MIFHITCKFCAKKIPTVYNSISSCDNCTNQYKFDYIWFKNGSIFVYWNNITHYAMQLYNSNIFIIIFNYKKENSLKFEFEGTLRPQFIQKINAKYQKNLPLL